MKPVAFLHTLHLELGQTQNRVTFFDENPWGVQGLHYSAEYEVVTTPLYALDPEKEFKRQQKIERRREQDRQKRAAMLKRYGLDNLKTLAWKNYAQRERLTNEQWTAGTSLFELYRAHGVLCVKDWRLAEYEEQKGLISFEKTEGRL